MQSSDEISIVATENLQPFAKLHDDILFLILEKLQWIDRIRAGSVCKKWLQDLTKIPYDSQGKFPWLFSRKFYDSSSGFQVRLADGPSKRTYVIQSGQRLFPASVCASKFGWILMTRLEEWRGMNPISNHCFVYCPFNYKSMNLPTYKNHIHHSTPHYTFSSNPTLPGCVFFVVRAPYYKWIEIRTCRIGDNEWETYQIDLMSIPYVGFSIECINGLLYVVLLRENAPNVEGDPILNSHVGTFDPESKEWKLIKNEKGIIESNGKKVKAPIKEWSVNLVLYNNKELYLVRQIPHDGVWDIFRYDTEENQWVEQPDLGSRVLFCCISSFLVDAIGNLSNLANIVFFGYGGSTCHPYSFSSRKIEDDHEHYVEDRTYEDDYFYERVWIMPPI